jgi:Yippee zinc-binding/DNA-binding /Mis18, centromere assembly
MFLQLQRILTLLLVLMTQAFDKSIPQSPFFIDSEVTESQESSTKNWLFWSRTIKPLHISTTRKQVVFTTNINYIIPKNMSAMVVHSPSHGSMTATNSQRASVAQSPRNGGTSAPVNNILGPSSPHFAPSQHDRPRTPTLSSTYHSPVVARTSSFRNRRPRAVSREEVSMPSWSDSSTSSPGFNTCLGASRIHSYRKSLSLTSVALAKMQSRCAQHTNDAMVYLEGPQVYSCGQCRTHLTSHDEIISKSFHGRHGTFICCSFTTLCTVTQICKRYCFGHDCKGRAYLFDQCVNVTIGPAEDRLLMTGLHSVSDIYCKRCKGMVGWTYAKAYEFSQKYKEGKFIIEKINLNLEESDYFDVCHPAGERGDRWRKRTMSWGSTGSMISAPCSPADPFSSGDVIYQSYSKDMSPVLRRYWETQTATLTAFSPTAIPPLDSNDALVSPMSSPTQASAL